MSSTTFVSRHFAATDTDDLLALLRREYRPLGQPQVTRAEQCLGKASPIDGG